MTRVIHAPALSDEKRKLPSRPQPSAPEAPREEEAGAAAVAPPPDVVPKAEMEAAVAQAREAALAEYRAQAQAAYDAALEQGRQDGLRGGQQAGEEEGRRRLEAETQRVRQLAEELEAAAKRQVLGLEDLAVAIAYEAVCKVLGADNRSAEMARAAVAQVTRQAAHSERIVVRVRPDDLPLLQPHQQQPAGQATNVTWRADPSIDGGCVVEIGGAQLDARLSTQLEQLRTTLLAARGR